MITMVKVPYQIDLACEYPVGRYDPNYRSAALTAILVILKLEMGFKLAPKVIYSRGR
jgi:hypothetical protein